MTEGKFDVPDDRSRGEKVKEGMKGAGVATTAIGVVVVVALLLFINNKIERSLGRLAMTLGEVRGIQEDTGGLTAALDLAERQRQAQAERIMQLIKALREAGVEVPPLPKNGSALSLGPVSAPSNGGGDTTSPTPTPQPGTSPPAQPPAGPTPQPSPQPMPTPSPADTCFEPPPPIPGPICIGAP